MLGPLLFLLAVLLVTWLLRRFLQYRLKNSQSEARREVGPKAPPVRPREPTPLPSRVMAPHATPLPAVAPLVASRRRIPSRLGSSREVRRGIVLMTILSPCRALEPPEFPPYNHG